LKISRDRVAKIANTEIIITAALVTTPAVVLMPCETASNAEIVRQVLKAWNGGDVEAMVGRLTSDFEFVTAGVVPDLRRGMWRPRSRRRPRSGTRWSRRPHTPPARAVILTGKMSPR
jgi:hypothetical protein